MATARSLPWPLSLIHICFEDGYQGLIYSRFRVMTPADFSGILTRGGTILGTSRTPFKRLNIPEADGVEKVPAMVHTYHKLQLDCLFMLGGNGSTKTANRLREEGLNVIALQMCIRDRFKTMRPPMCAWTARVSLQAFIRF